MKQLISLILLFFLSNTGALAQRFDWYLRHNEKDELVFRYYRWGLRVLDDNGKELRKTEPLFMRGLFSDELGRAAVCIPILSLENDKKTGVEEGRIWVCLDYELKPVFVFPSNTYRVSKIMNGLFFYNDIYGHSYNTSAGLVSRDGRVIFLAPYDVIYLVEDWCIGVKNTTETIDCAGLQTWTVEFKKGSSDSVLIVKLKVPEEVSYGLTIDSDSDDDELRWFKEELKNDVFIRGLNLVIHNRKEEALECFKQALQSEDPKIAKCAEFNIDALAWYFMIN